MSCIYLFNHNGNKYIGSTINLKNRTQAHNQHKKQPRHNKTKFYQYLLNNNIEDCREFITPVCVYTDHCTKYQLRLIEQHFLDDYKPNLNSIKAINTKNKVWV